MTTKPGLFSILLLLLSACGREPLPHPAPQAEIDPARSQEIRTENRKQVDAALVRMIDGQVIEVREVVESQCGGTPSRYRLKRIDGRLLINLRLMFVDAKPSQLEQVQACLPAITKFWERYGLGFELEFAKDELDRIDHSIRLFDDGERSHSRSWHLGAPRRCGMVLHEIGHLLGLPDEYTEENTCRTQEFEATEEAPWSLMEYHAVEESAELFSRHFKTILAPAFDTPLAYQLPKVFNLRPKHELELKAGKSPSHVWTDASGNSCSLTVELTRGNTARIAPEMSFEVKSWANHLRKRSGTLETSLYWYTEAYYTHTLIGIRQLECKLKNFDWQSARTMIASDFALDPVP